MINLFCHQVPAASMVLHHLGLFYRWDLMNVIPNAGKIVCHLLHLEAA